MAAPKPKPTSSAGSPWSSKSKKLTPLQAHAAFFDRDNDGIIWPTDTYIGSRTLQLGILASLLFTISIHMSLSYPTWGSFFPDPFFRIRVDLMHKAKHDSDTGAYTTLGEFDIKRFDYIFDKYSDPPHTHLSFWQIIKLLRGIFQPYNFTGWFTATREWMFTYLVLWPADPRGIARDDVKGLYNGDIFYKVAGKMLPKY